MTEFAVCLPVLLLLVIGTVQACSALFLKQSLATAAYEGVRVAIDRNATNAAVTASATQVLTDRNTTGASIVTIPVDVTTVLAGKYVTVTVTAPSDANSMFGSWFFSTTSVAGSATMMKEYQ